MDSLIHPGPKLWGKLLASQHACPCAAPGNGQSSTNCFIDLHQPPPFGTSLIFVKLALNFGQADPSELDFYMLTILGRKFDRIKVRVLVASVMVVTLLGGLMLESVLDARQRIRESVERELIAHSQSTLVSLVEAFNLVDFTLKRARQEWLETGILRPHDQFIQDFPNFKELIVQVAVIGPDGYLLGSSLTERPVQVYLGDREHFSVHKATGKDATFVSRPVVGKVSGVTTIQFTRPIFDKNQNFAGVVVISVNPNYIARVTFDPLATAGMIGILVGADGGTRIQSIPNSTSTTAATSDASTRRQTAFVDDATHIWHKTPLESLQQDLAVGYPAARINERLASVFWTTAAAFLLVLALVAWYTYGIFKLISSRNSLLLKLEESNLKANSANEMKSKFVAGISHELRTPLNGILGFSELVEMSETLEEAKKYGGIIRSSSAHLHQLVNTLLDLAKIEAGQMTTVYTVSKVWELFESVVSLHRYEAEKKGLLLTLNVSQGLPEVIRTDRIKLMQVLNNLVSNAVKFTEHGAIFVNVGLTADKWEISVVDTGVGMSREQIAGVFERFNNIKLESIRTSGKEGAGLGMALCRELIELMHGTIELQSELNSGTSVKIKLDNINE